MFEEAESKRSVPLHRWWRLIWLAVLSPFGITEAFARLQSGAGSKTPAQQIEEIGKLCNIGIEQILIVDTSGFLSSLTFSTRASLLLADTQATVSTTAKKDNLFLPPMDFIQPVFLNALAAPQFVALLSPANRFDGQGRNADIYQNIRHKCFVHLLYYTENIPSHALSFFGI